MEDLILGKIKKGEDILKKENELVVRGLEYGSIRFEESVNSCKLPINCIEVEAAVSSCSSCPLVGVRGFSQNQ